ncbi:ABC transporter permease [Nakamurella leprariae]|uniref:ABC transporter permease n=1 Tax=Nakamurella leprariae TaxID=2803911 RepID=A0A938Y421_9ACTN|nr:ABC transporter permease [Nakamurella leprariae]MBM9465676.1 ABC transporter permease [Nakamurella leprariae]
MSTATAVLPELDERPATRVRRPSIGWAGRIGAALLVVIVGVSLLAPLLAGDPLQQDLASILAAPSRAHPLGLDEVGRDVLDRVIWGGRTALSISLTAALIATVLGLALALGSALFGGWVDTLCSRIADVQLAVPTIVLAIVVLAFVGNSFVPIVVVLVLGSWVLTFRVLRGHARTVVEQQYIEAAIVAGAGRSALARRHLLPSVAPLFFVAFTLSASSALMLQASLGFLGLGVQPPRPDWGAMVASGRDALSAAWWVATAPGVAIVLTVLALQLFGDGLAERYLGGARNSEGAR